jgi:hypothetical protein
MTGDLMAATTELNNAWHIGPPVFGRDVTELAMPEVLPDDVLAGYCCSVSTIVRVLKTILYNERVANERLGGVMNSFNHWLMRGVKSTSAE